MPNMTTLTNIPAKLGCIYQDVGINKESLRIKVINLESNFKNRQNGVLGEGV